MPIYAMGWVPAPKHEIDKLPRFKADLQTLRQIESTPTIDLSSPPPFPSFASTYNQDRLGACGPFSAGENIIFDEGTVVPSFLFLYYVTRTLMGTIGQDSGVDNSTMSRAIQQYGWCDDSLWPYDESKLTVQPPQSAYTQAASRANSTTIAVVNQSLTDMKAALLQTKRPFIFGFSVYRSMMSNAVAKTGIVPMPGGILDTLAGGHDTLFVGYSDVQAPGVQPGKVWPANHFKFKNHWVNSPTEPWGDGGYGYIPYEYALNPQLASDFLSITAANPGGQPMPPDPVPPTPPTPPAPPSPVPPIWNRLLAIIERLLKLFGPLALPLIDSWVSTLPLPPVVIAAIDALLEKYLGHQLASVAISTRTLADVHRPQLWFGE